MQAIRKYLGLLMSPFIASEARRAISFNIGWMLFDRVFRMGLGVIIIIWLARHLGPTQFGQYSFALSVVAIAAAVFGLGLHEIVVKEITSRNDRDSGATMAAALMAALSAGAVGTLLLYILAVSAGADNTAAPLIAVLGLTLTFRGLEPVRSYFEAQVKSKVTILAEIAVFIIMAVTRIIFLWLQMDLMAFVWLLAVEAMLTALAFAWVFARYGDAKLRFHSAISDAIRLSRQALPLLLASLGVMLYMRIDQVMLGVMRDEATVGYYAAAVRISEIWYFIPVAIAASVFPKMMDAKQSDAVAYERLIVRLYAVMWIVSLLAIGFVAVFGAHLIVLLYGEAFAAAAPILTLHIYAGFFVALGSARGKWLLAEGLTKFIAISVFLGAGVNIVANLVLIPLEGGVGAAKATILAYGFAVVLVPLFYQPARKSISHMFFLGMMRQR